MKILAALIAALLLLAPAFAQNPAPSDQSNKLAIPSVDGDVGECSLAVTVLDGHGKPVDRAMVELNARYGGIFSKHDLDLTVYTNQDGKAQFTGLPEKTSGVAYVKASSGTTKGIAVYDPQSACENHHNIILAPERTAPAAPSNPPQP